MLNDFYKNKKVLVTGGSGSIGQKIVKELLKYDVDVVRVLDNNNQFLRISLSIYVDENKTLYLMNKIIDYLNNL